jgi:DNA polymerase-3 subunit gamma/tau
VQAPAGPDDEAPPARAASASAAAAAAGASPQGQALPPSTAGEPVQIRHTELGERWSQTVKQLGLVAMAREVALQAECIAVEQDGDAQVWRFKVERESLRAPALRDKLQAALAAHLSVELRVELEVGVAQDSPALRDLFEAQRRQIAAEEIIHSDPVVQQMLRQFKTARIVPGSIKPH